MGTSDKLLYLQDTKIAIKEAIEAKGQEVPLGTPFREYASKIANITSPLEWSQEYYESVVEKIVPYERPSDWLTLPTVLETEEKFVGLHAVYERSNFVALSASGAYTVDWGDGTVDNLAEGEIAQHIYNYSTYDTSNLTLCSRGYKQAIIVVTPQIGQHLTKLNLHRRHNLVSVTYSSGFLDIAISGQYLTSLDLGCETKSSITQQIAFRDLEQVNIIKSDLSTLERLFYGCISLVNVVNLSSSTREARELSCVFTDTGDIVTSVGHGLIDGDTVIVKSIYTTTGLAKYNRYFVIGSTLDTFQLSSAYGGSASNLINDGTGVLIYGTNFNSMFNTCCSLQTIPSLNTSLGTNFSSMFYNCYSLQTIPLLNTPSGTNFSFMFYNCYSLQTIPSLNISSGTNFSSMFNNCYSLQTIPLLNTSSGTNFGSMFLGCYSLQTISPLNTSLGTTFSSMFGNCYSLQTIPLLNTSLGTNFSSMFYNCYSLQTIKAKEFKVSFSVANCNLSAEALDEIYTNLPVVTGKTITVTGNYGVSGDTPSIATAKGWTVSG